LTTANFVTTKKKRRVLTKKQAKNGIDKKRCKVQGINKKGEKNVKGMDAGGRKEAFVESDKTEVKRGKHNLNER
jgi:hypothetical protein